MYNLLTATWCWICSDYRAHPGRFVLETTAWALSIACSVIFALTVPNPPFLLLYPTWITGCVIYSWAAWTRRSFGMLANYMLLVTIDCLGLLRLLF
jgi:hypothetical protein